MYKDITQLRTLSYSNPSRRRISYSTPVVPIPMYVCMYLFTLDEDSGLGQEYFRGTVGAKEILLVLSSFNTLHDSAFSFE